MSNDQKPARLRIVSSGAPTQSRRTAPIAPLTDTSTGPAGMPAGRWGFLSMILFLVGCAIGGAGLAAWPHLAG